MKRAIVKGNGGLANKRKVLNNTSVISEMMSTLPGFVRNKWKKERNLEKWFKGIRLLPKIINFLDVMPVMSRSLIV